MDGGKSERNRSPALILVIHLLALWRHPGRGAGGGAATLFCSSLSDGPIMRIFCQLTRKCFDRILWSCPVMSI